MGTGRLGRDVRRGLGALLLGCGSGIGGAVLLAPAAAAGPEVAIGTVAPAPVSISPGESVTFRNAVPTTTVTVPGALSSTTATVLTNEALGGACGGHTLAPGASVAQTFSASTSCPVSYSYSAQGAPLSAVQPLLPPLPSPTQVVITVVQAAQSAAASLPAQPAPLPAPAPAPLPAPLPGPAPAPVPATAGGSAGGTGGSGGGTTVVEGSAAPAGAAAAPPGGTTAQPGGPAGAVPAAQSTQSAPVDVAAARSFDPARFSPAASAGPVGRAGSSVPILSPLSGLPGSMTSGGPDSPAPAADANPPVAALPIAALAAVLALSAVFATLVRTHLAAREARPPRGAHAAR